MNDPNNSASERNKLISPRRPARSLPRFAHRNSPDEGEFRSLTSSSASYIRGHSLSALNYRTKPSVADLYWHSLSTRTSKHNQHNGRNSYTGLEFSSHKGRSFDERLLQTSLGSKAGSLIEQIRGIKRRLSEATAELTPTVYPLATRDVLTAVSLGRYEAAQLFVSSTQSVSNNGNKCIHSQCHCCADVLGFLAYLISANSSFQQSRWSKLREILRDHRPVEPSFCCPDVKNALKELVSISCELMVSVVPLDEMQEMERRLQAVDAEVVHLQNQMQHLQKLLDDVYSESNWRPSAVSEDLNANSMKTSSIVAWLDLATSSPTSDTESELRRQTNNPSRQANEQELDLRGKITALIADKEAELSELRRGAVKWASKHTLIRNKQAEIKELNGVLSNELAQAPDVSEADNAICTSKLQISDGKDLIGRIQSLRYDLAAFLQSFKQFDAQQLLPSLTSLSDTLTKVFARIQPSAESSDDTAEETAAQSGYLRYQQLEVGCADYDINEPLTVRVRQPIKAVRSGDTEVKGDEDLQVIDKFLSSSFPALPKQDLSSQDQKITQWNDELRDKNAEIEYLRLAVASLKQEANNNKEALQLLCESRLSLLERVGALTGGNECEDSFAGFVSKLRQINSPDEHLKTLDKCDDFLTQRLMDWSRKCQEGSEIALKQKEVEMKHLLARLEEEEALLKIHSDEANELRLQMKLLQQPFLSESYNIKEGPTESVPLLQDFKEPILLTQAIQLEETPSTDLDEFQPFKGVGEVAQTSLEAHLQSEIDNQALKISRLEARLCAQNEEFRAKLAEADEKTSQFNTIQCAYETDVQQLKTVLCRKTSEVSQLQQMLTSAKQEILDLTDQIKKLKSESELLQTELKFAQEELVMRSLQVENLQGALNEKTDELSDIREVVTGHEAQMRNLRFVLNNKDVDLIERDRRIEALSNKMEIIKADSEAVRNDFDQLNATFDRLWRSTLLMDDCAEHNGKIPTVKHEPMLVLKSSSAVDQFLSLLSSKGSETAICNVQASIKAYKTFQEKAKELNLKGNESLTIVKDDPDLPWNPCCVTAVSAISAITGDAKVFNLLRDLAYSESCRVRLANRLSNVESQKDQLKGMLSALQAEVETNHIQLAERNRQLILLGIDPTDTTVQSPIKTTSPSNSNTTVCYVDTGGDAEPEADFPKMQANSQSVSKTALLQKPFDEPQSAIVEKDKIMPQMESPGPDRKETGYNSERDITKLNISNQSARGDESVPNANANMEWCSKTGTTLTNGANKVKGDSLNMHNNKHLSIKMHMLENDIVENRAEKSRLQQQLHKIREKMEQKERTMENEKSKLAAEKDALSRSCEEMRDELERKEKERRSLEERMKEVVGAASHDAEVVAMEVEELRQRLHDVEEEKSRKMEECERLSREVAVLTNELNEAKARESAPTLVSMLPVEEPSVVEVVKTEPLLSSVPPVSMGETPVIVDTCSEHDGVRLKRDEDEVRVAEMVSRVVKLESELDGERAKVSKLAEDLAEREAEKDALSRSCEELRDEMERKEEERRSLEEKMKEVVGAASHDAEVVAMEVEELRQRLHDVEEEKSRKMEECERLSREVAALTNELNEAKARESAPTLVSMLPVEEPSVVEVVKTEPLLSSVPPVSMGETPVIVDTCSEHDGVRLKRDEDEVRVAEMVSRVVKLESELDGERAKVSKLAEDLAEREAEKDALSRSCEEMRDEMERKEEERRSLEERMKEVVGAASHDAEVVAMEVEELRQRLHDVEEEKSRKMEECERLSREVAALTNELNEAKARESAPTLVSMLPVEEPSVVEVVKTEPLLSSVPPVSMGETPVIVDIYHGYEEESATASVDEDQLIARLSALAEQVSTASSLQGEARNSWLLAMEQAESGVARLVRDGVDMKARLCELEADVKSLSAEVAEKDVRVEMLTREVAGKGEELERRDCSLRELESSMTEVSRRLLSQLEDLMRAVNGGEVRVAELMSMVEEVEVREGKLREEMMEKVLHERQLESELDGERAKVSKLAEDLAEREAEKDALSRSCEEMRDEMERKEEERRSLEERMKEVVGAASHDAEVVAMEVEELRQRLHDVEEEKSRKMEECERLSREVAVLTNELNEAKARESAPTLVSMLPVEEPSVVEVVKTEPLLSSVPPVSMGETPVIVDICHGYEEESATASVDEDQLIARLSALAEQVSTASSLQGEARNSWLLAMEQAESGVARLVRDGVDMKARLCELEADVKSLSAEVAEKDVRVEMLTREVAGKGEELERRDCSLRELESSMTEVSRRLLSQLEDLMRAVNGGEVRVAELMSMVEEVEVREGKLREEMMEKVLHERQLESELDGERAKVSKLAEDLAEREAEKDALSRSCEEMRDEMERKEEERRSLEERMKEVVGAASHDAEVVAMEVEELRQRLHDVEEEKSRKMEECERLSREVAVLTNELNEAKARESAPTLVSMLPVEEPSVVEVVKTEPLLSSVPPVSMGETPVIVDTCSEHDGVRLKRDEDEVRVAEMVSRVVKLESELDGERAKVSKLAEDLAEREAEKDALSRSCEEMRDEMERKEEERRSLEERMKEVVGAASHDAEVVAMEVEELRQRLHDVEEEKSRKMEECERLSREVAVLTNELNEAKARESAPTLVSMLPVEEPSVVEVVKTEPLLSSVPPVSMGETPVIVDTCSEHDGVRLKRDEDEVRVAEMVSRVVKLESELDGERAKVSKLAEDLAEREAEKDALSRSCEEMRDEMERKEEERRSLEERMKEVVGAASHDAEVVAMEVEELRQRLHDVEEEKSRKMEECERLSREVAVLTNELNEAKARESAPTLVSMLPVEEPSVVEVVKTEPLLSSVPPVSMGETPVIVDTCSEHDGVRLKRDEDEVRVAEMVSRVVKLESELDGERAKVSKLAEDLAEREAEKDALSRSCEEMRDEMERKEEERRSLEERMKEVVGAASHDAEVVAMEVEELRQRLHDVEEEKSRKMEECERLSREVAVLTNELNEAKARESAPTLVSMLPVEEPSVVEVVKTEPLLSSVPPVSMGETPVIVDTCSEHDGVRLKRDEDEVRVAEMVSRVVKLESELDGERAKVSKLAEDLAEREAEKDALSRSCEEMRDEMERKEEERRSLEERMKEVVGAASHDAEVVAMEVEELRQRLHDVEEEKSRKMEECERLSREVAVLTNELNEAKARESAPTLVSMLPVEEPSVVEVVKTEPLLSSVPPVSMGETPVIVDTCSEHDGVRLKRDEDEVRVAEMVSRVVKLESELDGERAKVSKLAEDLAEREAEKDALSRSCEEMRDEMERKEEERRSLEERMKEVVGAASHDAEVVAMEVEELRQRLHDVEEEKSRKMEECERLSREVAVLTNELNEAKARESAPTLVSMLPVEEPSVVEVVKTEPLLSSVPPVSMGETPVIVDTCSEHDGVRLKRDEDEVRVAEMVSRVVKLESELDGERAKVSKLAEDLAEREAEKDALSRSCEEMRDEMERKEEERRSLEERMKEVVGAASHDAEVVAMEVEELRQRLHDVEEEKSRKMEECERLSREVAVLTNELNEAKARESAPTLVSMLPVEEPSVVEVVKTEPLLSSVPPVSMGETPVIVDTCSEHDGVRLKRDEDEVRVAEMVSRVVKLESELDGERAKVSKLAEDLAEREAEKDALSRSCEEMRDEMERKEEERRSLEERMKEVVGAASHDAEVVAMEVEELRQRLHDVEEEKSRKMEECERLSREVAVLTNELNEAKARESAPTLVSMLPVEEPSVVEVVKTEPLLSSVPPVSMGETPVIVDTCSEHDGVRLKRDEDEVRVAEMVSRVVKLESELDGERAKVSKLAEDLAEREAEKDALSRSCEEMRDEMERKEEERRSLEERMKEVVGAASHDAEVVAMEVEELRQRLHDVEEEKSRKMEECERLSREVAVLTNELNEAKARESAPTLVSMLPVEEPSVVEVVKTEPLLSSVPPVSMGETPVIVDTCSEHDGVRLKRDEDEVRVAEMVSRVVKLESELDGERAKVSKLAEDLAEREAEKDALSRSCEEMRDEMERKEEERRSLEERMKEVVGAASHDAEVVAMEVEELRQRLHDVEEEKSRKMEECERLSREVAVLTNELNEAKARESAPTLVSMLPVEEPSVVEVVKTEPLLSSVPPVSMGETPVIVDTCSEHDGVRLKRDEDEVRVAEMVSRVVKLESELDGERAKVSKLAEDLAEREAEKDALSRSCEEMRDEMERKEEERRSLEERMKEVVGAASHDAEVVAMEVEELRQRLHDVEEEKSRKMEECERLSREVAVLTNELNEAKARESAPTLVSMLPVEEPSVVEVVKTEPLLSSVPPVSMGETPVIVDTCSEHDGVRLKRDEDEVRVAEMVSRVVKLESELDGERAKVSKLAEDLAEREAEKDALSRSCEEMRDEMERKEEERRSLEERMKEVVGAASHDAEVVAMEVEELRQRLHDVEEEKSRKMEECERLSREVAVLTNELNEAKARESAPTLVSMLPVEEPSVVEVVKTEPLLSSVPPVSMGETPVIVDTCSEHDGVRLKRDEDEVRVAEMVSRVVKLESELDGERAKVSKLAEDLAEREAEKDALSRSCEEMRDEMERKEEERRSLEERMKEVVGAASHDAEVVAMEVEELRQRLHDVEEEKSRKMEECERLSREVAVLTNELNEAKARESAPTLVSMLPVEEPSVVEVVKTEPLLSSVPPVSMGETPVIVDIYHGYEEESATASVDEDQLIARLSALAEQVSTASSLQGEARNSWLLAMEQAESGVARLVRDGVDMKARLCELEADVKSLSAEVAEKDVRVEMLTREVAGKGEELERRDCSLRELESSMTEVSRRLLSQLEDLMRAVNGGEVRVAELMSMVEEVEVREGKLREEMMEKVLHERQLESELDGERAKVSKLAEDLAEREAEKDALSRSCEEMRDEMERKEEERRSLEERMKEVVGAATHDAEVVAMEVEELRQRLHDVEEEKSRKMEECERLSREVAVLTNELNEAKARESAPTLVSMLPVEEPSVVEVVKTEPLLSSVPPVSMGETPVIVDTCSEHDGVRLKRDEDEVRVAEMVSRVVKLESELDGERAKVSKLAEDLAEREAEKDALSRSCEEMRDEMERKEEERRSLEERMKEVVGAASHDAEVVAMEVEELRQRLHDVEEEKSRKMEECERLSREVAVLTNELNEAKARESAPTLVSMLPVEEPSVVEVVKTEPLLSSVPPVSMGETPVIVDIYHGYEEESATASVDEDQLIARLSALAEQVSTASSLQGEARNSWLLAMEQAESGVARLVRDGVDMKARLCELEADVKSLSAEVAEKDVRVEMLTREVAGKGEELERRDCSLRELESSMTEVSRRLLSQLEDLMRAVNGGEVRVAELMSMVEEVEVREGKLREEMMEKVLHERQLESELDGERAKVSKLAEDLAEREAEKDALSRSCEEMRDEMERKEEERRSLEERMKEVVGAASHDAEVVAMEVEELRQRLHDVEEEKSRKMEECERLSREVAVLTNELNEAKARESAPTLVSMLPVEEPSVVEVVKTEPLLSSVPPVSMGETPVIVDTCSEHDGVRLKRDEDEVRVAEMVSRVVKLESELDGERAKVSKLAEDLAEREAEKDALSRSCEEMRDEMERKEEERRSLEERMKEVVGAASHDAEVVAMEVEELRQRLHDVEEEKSRKMEECERLSREVAVLTNELNEAKARESAPTLVSMLPVEEPSVVEVVKTEPLLSSVPPVSTGETPVIVDIYHGYEEESATASVDEDQLIARLSALAEQVSTASSLQGEARNSWLLAMEQAESGVARLVRDGVDMKARLCELEADVKSLSAEVAEKDVRVEMLTREVAGKGEELERRDCSLRELESSMTEVSRRLLSQLEDLMRAVNGGEVRVAELMSMVEEVEVREGKLREEMMEKVLHERQLESELDGERAKVSKLAEDLAEREAEKDALSRSCEEMRDEMERKEEERRSLEERMKEVVGAASHDAEVVAMEVEELRQRLHDVEEEKSRKMEECERLSREVAVLTNELNEAKARESAPTLVSMLPVEEPSVVEVVKTEPLLSSVPPVSMGETPVIVDTCSEHDGVRLKRDEDEVRVAEMVSRVVKLESELDGERAKVSKLAEDLAEREAEKDALSRSCEEMRDEMERKEEERRSLEERMKEVVGAASHDAEVVAMEVEELRQRLHDVEEEKSRKMEECERLSREVAVLTNELNEAKARESAPTLVSMLPVEEPSVVEVVKTEPLLSSVPPVSMGETPVIVDIYHGYEEESATASVDEDQLIARLSALAEQVSTASSLQGEARNSWLLAMEQAESGVARLVRDGVDMKARLCELEADVKSLSAEVAEKDVRVEMLTREVAGKGEELERRDCSLRELESSMTEVSRRLLSQLEDLMRAVNGGEVRVAELMSMVEEVEVREGKLREEMMEKVLHERQLESELDGERAKVSKLAEDLAEREAEKDALSRSCEEMRDEMERKEEERRSLEERMKEVVGAASHDAEVVAMEVEELRQRLHDVEEEKSRKMEECERLSREVAVLTNELNEAKARESAPTLVSMLPVEEPSVVEVVKTEPLLSSVPPVSMGETPVIVDIYHGYEEESATASVDEDQLIARLSALAEQVSTASSLQGEARNSWLLAMEQAESGVARLVRDGVDMKARLCELEADVKSLSAEVAEKDVRVEMLTREVAGKGEELERRDCSLRELESSMTEVSRRLLSQLEDLMRAVNGGEVRVAELMSMVEEVEVREGKLREEMMEKVLHERQLESELDGERAKVSKLAEDLAEREAEKDALSRSCEEMRDEMERKEEERRSLEERMKEVVGAASHDAEVVAMEVEELRQRLHDVEEEKSRKMEECERLSREVAVLTNELNEAKARESAPTLVSMLPVEEPSVVEVVKTEPLLSSVPPVSMGETPVIVDTCSEHDGERLKRDVDEVRVAEMVSRVVKLESELDGERAKVSKLVEDLAERQAEKDALSRSCEEMRDEMERKEEERRSLEERMKEVVGAASHDAEVVAMEVEELRQRLHDVEEEKSRKMEECERLSREVAVLTNELNEAKARESAPTLVSMLPVEEPSVVEAAVNSSCFTAGPNLHRSDFSVGSSAKPFASPPCGGFAPDLKNISDSLNFSFSSSCYPARSSAVGQHEGHCPVNLSPFYVSLLVKVVLLQQFVHECLNIVAVPSSFLDVPVVSCSISSLSARLSASLFDLKFAFNSLALASNAMDVGSNPNKDCISPLNLQPSDSSFLSSAADFLISGEDGKRDQEFDSSSIAQSLLCIASCLNAQLQRFIFQCFGCAEGKSTLDDDAKFVMFSWSDFFSKLKNLCHRAPSQPLVPPILPDIKLPCICHLAPSEVDRQLNAIFNLKSKLLDFPSAQTSSTEFSSVHPLKLDYLTKCSSQSEPDLYLPLEQELLKRRTIRSLDCFSKHLSIYTDHYRKPSPLPLTMLADQLSNLRLWLVDDTRRPFNPFSMPKALCSSVSFEIPPTELFLRRLLNIRDTEVLYLLNNLPGGENLINRSSTPNVFPSRDCTEAQLELMSNWDMVQPIDPSCLPVYRVKLPEVGEAPVVTGGHHSDLPAAEVALPPPNDIPLRPSTSASETSLNSLSFESKSEIKLLLRRCWNLLKEMVSIMKRSSQSKLLRTRADELLDTSLHLSRLLSGATSTSMEYEVTADTATHVDFRKIPDSPGIPRKWSRAPIQELIWAIETLDDMEELRSLAHLLTQQYNAVGTTLEQQLNVNRDLRNRLREANNHLARIYLGVSQGNQRLAVMTERLLVEAQKHDEISSTCGDINSPKPHCQNPMPADTEEACAQSGPSDSPASASFLSSPQKTKRHGKVTLLHSLRQAMMPKSKK